MAAPLKGTFFAFRPKGRAGVLTGATVTHVVLMLALLVVMAVIVVALFAPTSAGSSSDNALLRNEAAVQAMLLAAPLVFIGACFFYAVVAASYEAALLRWMVRGEPSGFGGFSLGADTWRIYAGYWIWFLIGAGVWVVTAIVVMLAAGAMGYVGGEGQDEQTAWLGLALLAAWVLVVAPLALRMSTGNAASVARRKFAYFESWRVSRDRSFALFGSFLILWTIWLALLLAIFIGVSFVTFSIFPDEEPSSNAAAASVNLLMSAGSAASIFIANMVLAFLSAGVNARAVQVAIEEGKLEGLTPDLAKVFD